MKCKWSEEHTVDVCLNKDSPFFQTPCIQSPTGFDWCEHHTHDEGVKDKQDDTIILDARGE